MATFYNTKAIRNLALLGHGECGKTSLAEAMLYLSGKIDRRGKIADGNTVCDFDPEEQKRGLSISAALAHIEWKDTKSFRMHQMLTIHSSTFRTALMKEWSEPLPRKIFYEDNLMICKTLPQVKKLYYFPKDLYRYWIGRPDQSVQEATIIKRYSHQVTVSGKSFIACDLASVNEPKLKKYLKHEVFMLLAIAIVFARLNKTEEADANLEAMWDECREHDRKWANHYRYRTPLAFICIRGKLGRGLASFFYRIANKIVRFN